MTFVHPHVVWLAAFAPVYLLALFLYDRARRRGLTGRLGQLPVIVKLAASASPRRRVIKLVLVQLALALVVVALARPQLAGKRKVELRGLDLVVAIDVSKSMLVDDVGQTAAMVEDHVPASRLARARELAAALIDELPGDRIGPVVFAGLAAHFPLTEDREVAKQFLDDLGPTDLPFGSNLTEVFRLSHCLLRPALGTEVGCAGIGRHGHGGDPLPNEAPEVDPKPDVTVEQKAERGKAIVVFTDGADPDPSIPATHVEVERTGHVQRTGDEPGDPGAPWWAIAGAGVLVLVAIGFALRRAWLAVGGALIVAGATLFAGYWVVDLAGDARPPVTRDSDGGKLDLGMVRLDPETLEELHKASDLGIAVFLVGVGTAHGGVVHELDDTGRPTTVPRQTADGQTVVSKRDDAGMTALAAAGGDPRRYFIASETGEVDPTPIVAALHAVDRGLAVKNIDEKRDVDQPFLFAGLMLLVVEAAIATRRRRRYPEERT